MDKPLEQIRHKMQTKLPQFRAIEKTMEAFIAASEKKKLSPHQSKPIDA